MAGLIGLTAATTLFGYGLYAGLKPLLCLTKADLADPDAVRACVDTAAERLGGTVPDDLHKPFIDAVTFPCEQCGGEMRRVQFTSDLLPSDVLGVSVFDQRRAEFVVSSQRIGPDERLGSLHPPEPRAPRRERP